MMQSVMTSYYDMIMMKMYLEYADARRAMIPWHLAHPIQDPAEGEWTHERIVAGFTILNKLLAAKNLVEKAAVYYLESKGYIFPEEPVTAPPSAESE